jgi:hypothetical protein
MISAKIFLDGAISLVYDKDTNWIGSMFQGLSRKHRTIRFGQGGRWSNGRTARFTPMQSRFESGSPINPNKRGRGVPAPRPLIKKQAFGSEVDYGQIVKVYAGEPGTDAARRYSPGVVVDVRKAVIAGGPA